MPVQRIGAVTPSVVPAGFIVLKSPGDPFWVEVGFKYTGGGKASVMGSVESQEYDFAKYKLTHSQVLRETTISISDDISLSGIFPSSAPPGIYDVLVAMELGGKVSSLKLLNAFKVVR